MSQIKIYGLAHHLNPIKRQLSDVIHGCVMEVLGLPADKRAHRFFPLAREDFYYPDGRSEAYTILELSMIEGRTVETRKKLVRTLFERIYQQLGITPNDLEITIHESAACNWGFRGLHGDEARLSYKIEV